MPACTCPPCAGGARLVLLVSHLRLQERHRQRRPRRWLCTARSHPPAGCCRPGQASQRGPCGQRQAAAVPMARLRRCAVAYCRLRRHMAACDSSSRRGNVPCCFVKASSQRRRGRALDAPRGQQRTQDGCMMDPAARACLGFGLAPQKQLAGGVLAHMPIMGGFDTGATRASYQGGPVGCPIITSAVYRACPPPSFVTQDRHPCRSSFTVTSRRQAVAQYTSPGPAGQRAST